MRKGPECLESFRWCHRDVVAAAVVVFPSILSFCPDLVQKVEKLHSGRSPRLVRFRTGYDDITARPQAALGPKTHLITVKSNCSVVSGIPILWWGLANDLVVYCCRFCFFPGVFFKLLLACGICRNSGTIMLLFLRVKSLTVIGIQWSWFSLKKW